MPAWAVALIGGAGAVFGNALVTAYFYGRLSQRVESNEKDLDNHAQDMRDQQTNIGNLRADMGKVKGHLGLNGTL